jgi:predicted RNA-binding Zn-ribbon protein involved in translation (DUF1610 family)
LEVIVTRTTVHFRLFTISSALSLLLLVATGVFWIRSYRARNPDLLVLRSVNLELISGEGSVSVFHQIPFGVTQIDIQYWKLALAFAAMPAIWPLIWWRFVRLRYERPDVCRACSYDLTGNVSGVCPECGARIESDQKSNGRQKFA